MGTATFEAPIGPAAWAYVEQARQDAPVLVVSFSGWRGLLTDMWDDWIEFDHGDDWPRLVIQRADVKTVEVEGSA